ncbi:MAG: sigma-70 family RNA polymerase sigma factor [Gemmatimonadales bacterium]|nr:MAG: sigma-70 family RNA polymerase sigma factor [Gemmatimonadales bacterium]
MEGRQSAFGELLSRYERPVFSLVVRMVRDPSLAEDLAQEAFIKAFNALDRYDPSYKFSNWIFKIANNLTIDHLRRRKLDTVSLDAPTGGEGNGETEGLRMQLPDGGETPEEYTESRELGGRIEAAIGHLRPEYRTAILLRHVEGHAYDEIADIMELPLGTVKTYIHRGRSELKELLQEVTA